ncbi:hypothetical protein ANS017_01550 [Paraclostridium bifermentans]|uniref:hypothetical protein n=1 Tax=Paraclostridium bifermentans TaxID=1490 RepID=UPI001FF4EF9B|nr:hypothetical protein [Paraclostridium bifermentans]UOW69577.1 hypothetical protein MTR78_17105 [Paraclostridium bifermentans]GKZ02917.1 hypothetical protein ANS014_13510 [Paraclostridium bifermentans]GKZ06434.1 hypothetical protein ANS015_13170 [Paraclostridium bifermentans]GKZ08771.1 hypothetical protein ANS017_01550 [Paraclostridium bifermentans]
MKTSKIKTTLIYLAIVIIVKNLVENTVRNMFLSNILIFLISLILIIGINSIADVLRNRK